MSLICRLYNKPCVEFRQYGRIRQKSLARYCKNAHFFNLAPRAV